MRPTTLLLLFGFFFSIAAAEKAFGFDGSTSLQLRATVSKAVLQDQLQISLYLRQEGETAKAVQMAINSKMKELVEQAKGVAGVEVHVQNYRVYFDRRDRQHSGRMAERSNEDARKPHGQWVGQQYMSLTSADFEAVRKLASDLQAQEMALGNIYFSVSANKTQAVRDSLIEPATARLFEKARLTASALNTSIEALSQFAVDPSSHSPRRMAAMTSSQERRGGSNDLIVAEPRHVEIYLSVEGEFKLEPVSF